MHPLLQLLATRPQLLADHVQGYGALAGVELERVSKVWIRRAALGAVTCVGIGVTAVLAGVAVMLWATIPASQMPAPWVLLVVPLPTALLAAACLLALRGGDQRVPFAEVRQQIDADIALFREAGVR